MCHIPFIFNMKAAIAWISAGMASTLITFLCIAGCILQYSSLNIAVNSYANSSDFSEVLQELLVFIFTALCAVVATWTAISCLLAGGWLLSESISQAQDQKERKRHRTLQWALKHLALPTISRAALAMSAACTLGIGAAQADNTPIEQWEYIEPLSSITQVDQSLQHQIPNITQSTQIPAQLPKALPSDLRPSSETLKPQSQRPDTHSLPANKPPAHMPPSEYKKEKNQVNSSSQNSNPSSTFTITVQPGDSLWSIAARTLGPKASPSQIAKHWPQIYKQNPQIKHPNLIYPGQVLTFTWQGEHQ